MTQENIDKVIQTYKYSITKHSVDTLKRDMENAPDECADNLSQVKIKKISIVLLLSIFLGFIGLDRFYVDDRRLAISKIIFTVLTVAIRFIPSDIAVIIANILTGFMCIWYLMEIYNTFQCARIMNASRLSYYISLQSN